MLLVYKYKYWYRYNKLFPVCYSWYSNGGSRQSEFRDRVDAGQTNAEHWDPPPGHPSVGPENEQVSGQSHWL